MNTINMKTFHVDGGAFLENPGIHQKFVRAYFSVCDDKGNLVHFDDNIGDRYSGEAEYFAIKWVVDNITERPIAITSDCSTAMAWVRHSTKVSKRRGLSPLNLHGIKIQYKHNNYADIWNAQNHSPKYIKGVAKKTRYHDLFARIAEQDEHLRSII